MRACAVMGSSTLAPVALVVMPFFPNESWSDDISFICINSMPFGPNAFNWLLIEFCSDFLMTVDQFAFALKAFL